MLVRAQSSLLPTPGWANGPSRAQDTMIGFGGQGLRRCGEIVAILVTILIPLGIS